MPDYFYLDSKIKYIDGKRNYSDFDLYNHEKYIKSFNKEESKLIRDRIKKEKIERKVYGNKVIVDDQRFVKHIINLDNNKKRKREIKKRKLIVMAISGTMLLTLGSTNLGKLFNSNVQSETVVYAYDDDNYSEDDDFIEENGNSNIEEITSTKEITNEEDIITTEKDLITTENDIVTTEKYETTEEEKKTTIDDGYDDIFSFISEDRSNSQNTYTVSNYDDIINKYSSTYGIDAKLMKAIICQENPNNDHFEEYERGHGLTQIEYIWDNNTVTSYNFDSNKYVKSNIIDVRRCEDDADYAIELGYMILNNYYNYIHNNYGDKLSSKEEVAAAVFAYNKGIGAIENALINTDNFTDFTNYVKINAGGGDDDYIEHVFSYFEDEDVITMKTSDGQERKIMIDNLNVENKKTRLK